MENEFEKLMTTVNIFLDFNAVIVNPESISQMVWQFTSAEDFILLLKNYHLIMTFFQRYDIICMSFLKG